MTPKEKAKELVHKYYIHSLKGKECALIAVDEIISMQEQVNIKFDFNIKYWNKVKEEIHNL